MWNNDQRMKWFKRSAKISIHWSSSRLCLGKTQGLKDAYKNQTVKSYT